MMHNGFFKVHDDSEIAAAMISASAANVNQQAQT